MFRKKQIAAIVIGMASVATMVSAHAAPVALTAGNIQILLSSYDAGTTGYQPVPLASLTSTTPCTTEAGCDAAATSPAPGALPIGPGGTKEDSWGIITIDKIKNVSTGVTLFSSGAGHYLTGIFYGLTDYRVDAVNMGGTIQESAYMHGGMLDVWDTATDYTPALGAGGRLGANGYTSITDVPKTLALSAAFGAGVDALQPSATYKNHFDSSTFAGGGQGFLDVTGGYLQYALETNKQQDAVGNYHDLFLNTTFDNIGGSASSLGWTVTNASQVKGAVPEPGSMALAGLGLMGLAALRRRKTQG